MKRTHLLPPALLVSVALLTGCGAEAGSGGSATTPTPSTSATDDGADQADPAVPAEAAGPQRRLAVTHDGGLLVLDPDDGSVLLDEPLTGFHRLAPAGDDRHLFVTGGGAFTALDLGAWTDAHGDHGHSWTVPPALTDLRVEAAEPGHVVPHGRWTTLFDDATGEVTALEAGGIETGAPVTRTFRTPDAHHGVAVLLDSGHLVETVGDEESRSGVRVLDRRGRVVAESDECPGVHGEAFAGDVAAFGCEDGLLLLDGERFTKVESPDAYGRIGNQAGHPDSPYVLGDYKTDPDAELERPARVSLVDTRDGGLELVDLGTSYSFRSLGRGPDGEGLVLGTDGALHVVDPERARVTARIEVTEPWREPTDWQQPRPTLLVLGDTAYVTEPETRELHVVDLAAGDVTASHELPEVPNELHGVTG